MLNLRDVITFQGRSVDDLKQALADSIDKSFTVVPVCPLFARHLQKHGDEFLADGGRFRRPTRADVALVPRPVREEGHAVTDS